MPCESTDTIRNANKGMANRNKPKAGKFVFGIEIWVLKAAVSMVGVQITFGKHCVEVVLQMPAITDAAT